MKAAYSVRVPQGASVCVQNRALGLGVREVTELGPLWGNPGAGLMPFTFLGPGAPMARSPEFPGLGPGWLRDGLGPLLLDTWAVPGWFAFPSSEQRYSRPQGHSVKPSGGLPGPCVCTNALQVCPPLQRPCPSPHLGCYEGLSLFLPLLELMSKYLICTNLMG